MSMRLSIWLLIVSFAMPSFTPSLLFGQGTQAGAGIWVVEEYDPDRDPFADLRLTTERAQAEHKRILLDVGGTWCGWCHRLDLYFAEQPSVALALAEGFLIMKVSWTTKNQNKEFLSRYPEIFGYPHLFVLESDGAFLHSQDTSELEEGNSYDEKAMLSFLQSWAPERDRQFPMR